MALYDSTGLLVCSRALSLHGSPDTTGVHFCTGNAHVYLESVYHSAGWFVYAFLLDTFPDDPQFLEHPVVGNGTLTSVGAADGYGYIEYAYAIDNSAGNVTTRVKGISTINGTEYSPSMASGRDLYVPAWITQQVGSNVCWTGKFPQALVGNAAVSAWTDFTVPIDYVDTGTFKATFLVNTSGTPFRLYMRIA
jgi:hypothetical protein